MPGNPRPVEGRSQPGDAPLAQQASESTDSRGSTASPGGLPPLEPYAPPPPHPDDAEVLEAFFDDAETVEEDDAVPESRLFERHVVTAVLVSHNGARWLPYVLRALAGLTRGPQRILAVDTGSTDASAELLSDALGASSVMEMPSTTGFGEAVSWAVDSRRGAPGLPTRHDEDEGDAVEWLWLLHDDCAPEPETLRLLLAAVDSSPSIAVAGPKIRGWSDSSRLLEVGVTIGGGGRRETGLERGELDQGQHDGRRDVLAVGTAGMLVRRDVWDALGGFDPRLVLFRDDVDFGWRTNLAGHRVVIAPEAIVHHIEAAAHGRRTAHAVDDHLYRADRRAALHTLLANAPAWSLPWHWLRLFVGSLLRTVGLLIGKAPGEAWNEIVASSSVLFLPGPLVAARRARAATRTVPAGSTRPLMAPPMSGLRHGLDAVGQLFGSRADRAAGPSSALESGPVDEESEQLSSGPSRFRALVRRPGFLLTCALVLVSLVAFRGLLYGSGLLQGGMLYPTGGGVGSLWTRYLAGWHEVGVGSATPAPPYLVPLTAMSWVLLGKTWLAVDVLLVLAGPLAGATAYVLMGRIGVSRPLRLAGAVTYALLPAVTGAVAGGRLGTAVAAWLLPVVGWQAYRTLTGGSMRRAWVTGLLLAVLAAFVPWLAVLVAVVGLVAVAAFGTRSLGTWLRLGAMLVVPPLVLLPWSLHALRTPAVMLSEAGAPSPLLADLSLPGWHLAVANPGGPGVPSAWVTLGLLLAGLAALLRSDRRRAVLGAWVVVLVGLVAGLALSGRTVTPDSMTVPVPIWPGPATLLVGGGLIVAAALAGDGARTRLTAFRFGWRQPVTAVLAVLALLAPVVLTGWWLVVGVLGSGSPLSRDATGELPAYVVASSSVETRPRALVLGTAVVPTATGSEGGSVAFAVVPGDGRLLGDAEVAPSAELTRRAEPAVATIVAGRGGTAEVALLASYGVGFIVLAQPVDPSVALALDGVPGLSRLGQDESGAVWRVSPAGARVKIVTSAGRTVPVGVVPSSATTEVDTALPPVPGGGTARLVLAEASDPGWHAALDGSALKPVVVDGWAQGFELPLGSDSTATSRLTVEFSGPRNGWLVTQLVLFLVVVLLALPTRRRSGLELDPGDAGDAAPDLHPVERAGSASAPVQPAVQVSAERAVEPTLDAEVSS